MNPNAKFALLIAEMHKNDPRFCASDEWRNFLVNPRMWHLKPGAKTQRIAENIWLIHLNSELPFLAVLIQALNDFQIPIRVLFFDMEPDWIQSPPKPV